MHEAATTERLDVWRDVIRENFVALDIAADRRATVARARCAHFSPSLEREPGEAAATSPPRSSAARARSAR